MKMPSGLQLYQKETPTQVFSKKCAKFLRAALLKSINERLLQKWLDGSGIFEWRQRCKAIIAEHLYRNSLLDLQLYLKILQHSCFPVNIAKFLRAPVLKDISKRLLLHIIKQSHAKWRDSVSGEIMFTTSYLES